MIDDQVNRITHPKFWWSRLANDDRVFAPVVILAGEPDTGTGPGELTSNALQLRYPQNQIRPQSGWGRWTEAVLAAESVRLNTTPPSFPGARRPHIILCEYG